MSTCLSCTKQRCHCAPTQGVHHVQLKIHQVENVSNAVRIKLSMACDYYIVCCQRVLVVYYTATSRVCLARVYRQSNLSSIDPVHTHTCCKCQHALTAISLKGGICCNFPSFAAIFLKGGTYCNFPSLSCSISLKGGIQQLQHHA